MSVDNSRIMATVAKRLLQMPYPIKNVMLVVNLEDIRTYQQAYAASCLIWLDEYGNVLPHLSNVEKCTILAQIIKQLGLTPADLMRFAQ